MKQKHPEYYALIGGQRDTGASRGRHAVLQFRGAGGGDGALPPLLYDAFDLPSVDIWPVDGLRICQCENCAGKSASDLVWGFADRVARQVLQSHPAKRVTCGAYTSYRAAARVDGKAQPESRGVDFQRLRVRS